MSITERVLGTLGLADRGGSNGKEPEDCIGCRLVGGGGCLGASAYVVYHGSKNSHPLGRIFTFLFAGALGGIGVSRLFGLPPFEKKQQQTDITTQ